MSINLDFKQLDNYAREKFREYTKRIHCQIDSNIHAEHYFYSKNCLQDPGTSRIICQYLLNAILGHDAYHAAKKDGKGLTLIGHKLYSELVLYDLCSYLKRELPEKVNYHIIMNSQEEMDLAGATIHDHIILVLPVSATFSSALRIEAMLNRRLKEAGHPAVIGYPFLHIFLITDGRPEEIPADHFLRKQFNWKEIDPVKREIIVSRPSSEDGTREEIKQQYLYPIHSKLYHVSDCSLCFPQKKEGDTDWLLNEVPLVELDMDNNTPNIISYLPSEDYRINTPGPMNELAKNVVITSDFLIYGHYRWFNRCFLYWFDVLTFLKRPENETQVIKWLKKIREQFQEEDVRGPVLLITPAYYNKSHFVFLVNRMVFDDKATIIYYNNDERFLDESANLFNRNIKNAGRIYFVDDVVDDEEFVLQMNNYVIQYKTLYSYSKQSQGNRQFVQANVEKTHAFDGLFAVIDRATTVSQQKIRLSMEKDARRHYFLRLTVPPTKQAYLGCPLCKSYAFYDAIIQASCLDSIKLHFAHIRNKIRPKRMLPSHHEPEIHHDALQPDHKYDPFINMQKNYLVEGTTQAEAIRFFEVRYNNGFNRSLLKVVIKHEVFSILCDPDKLASTRLKNVAYWGPAGRKEEAGRVFENILGIVERSELLELPIFNEIRQQNREVFSNLIRHLLVKQLSYPPFSNHKLLGPMVFTYILTQLEYYLQYSPQDFFTEYVFFRRLRLYLKCSAMLNSNYIFSRETLEKIRDIFTQGNDSINQRKDDFRRKIGQYGQAAATAEGMKKKFLLEVINNLKYKYNEIADFKYFIAGLIKHITYRNEVKSMVLEKNLSRFDEDYHRYIREEDPAVEKYDFWHLYRILKFENIGQWQNYLRDHFALIKGTDFERSCMSWKGDIKDYIRLLGQRSGPGLPKNLGQEGEAFLHTLLLLTFLHLDKSQHVQDETADKANIRSSGDKLATILENISDILDLKEKAFQVSISVELSGDQNNEGALYTQIFNSDTRKTAYDKSEAEGFVKQMLEGVSMYSNNVPLTFAEIHRSQDGTYVSMTSDYFLCHNGPRPLMHEDPIDLQQEMKMAEALLPDRFNHYLFFRIARVSDDDGTIDNEGMAVITVCSRREGLWEPDKLRFLLLLREHLTRFINIQIKNDSFSELRMKEAKFDNVTTMQHGLERYTLALEKVFDDKIKDRIRDSDDTILEMTLLFRFLRNQLGNFFSFFGNRDDGQVFTRIGKCSKEQLKEHIQQCTRVIFGNSSIPESTLKPERDYTLQIIASGQAEYPAVPVDALCWIIIPEIVVNIKKRYRPRRNQERLSVTWQLEDEHIVISNTVDNPSRETFKHQPREDKPHGGLEMCSKHLESMNYDPIAAGYDNDRELFITTINLRPKP